MDNTGTNEKNTAIRNKISDLVREINACYDNITDIQDFEGVEYYLKDFDNVREYFYLGMLYYNGKGLPQSEDMSQSLLNESIRCGFKEEVPLYIQAAESGHASAQFLLGMMYFIGHVVPQDYNQAVLWYTRAAESGHVEAYNKLGVCSMYGYGTTQDDAKAFEWYTKAAEHGNVNGQYNMAKTYIRSEVVPQNMVHAIAWLQKAVASGCIDACYKLGICYELSIGTPQNEENAVKYYRKAAKAGHISAMLSLEHCYLQGLGSMKNISKAIKCAEEISMWMKNKTITWLSIMRKMGTAQKQLLWREEHLSYIKPGDHYTGMVYEWISKTILQGHAAIKQQLDDCYIYVRENKAVEWYEELADMGYDYAQYDLGKMYLSGSYVEKNHEKGIELLIKAAVQGQQDALNFLGSYYRNGNVMEVEKPLLLDCFRRAAKNGVADAQFLLSVIYHKGLGVEQNKEKSMKWLMKAVGKGSNEAKADLAYRYACGKGVAKDYEQAILWYFKVHYPHSGAYLRTCLGGDYFFGVTNYFEYVQKVKQCQKEAKQGNREAQFALGNRYAQGRVTRKNIPKAIAWYNRAACQGHVEAMYELGMIYLNVEPHKDYAQAIKWLGKAAKLKHSGSMYTLSMCYKEGKGVKKDLNKFRKWQDKWSANLDDFNLF